MPNGMLMQVKQIFEFHPEAKILYYRK